MRVYELDLVARETREALPPPLRTFRTWKRYTLVQLFYSQRRLHYEVWIRGNIKKLEIGLHCEADVATNTRLLALLQTRLFEIQAELGSQVEAEQWTTDARVHELVPYTHLDAETAHVCGERLAAMIMLLQPMISQRPIQPRALPSVSPDSELEPAANGKSAAVGEKRRTPAKKKPATKRSPTARARPSTRKRA